MTNSHQLYVAVGVAVCYNLSTVHIRVCIGYIGELQFVHVLYTVQGIPLYVNSNLYCVYNESHYCENGG